MTTSHVNGSPVAGFKLFSGPSKGVTLLVATENGSMVLNMGWEDFRTLRALFNGEEDNGESEKHRLRPAESCRQ